MDVIGQISTLVLFVASGLFTAILLAILCTGDGHNQDKQLRSLLVFAFLAFGTALVGTALGVASLLGFL